VGSPSRPQGAERVAYELPLGKFRKGTDGVLVVSSVFNGVQYFQEPECQSGAAVDGARCFEAAQQPSYIKCKKVTKCLEEAVAAANLGRRALCEGSKA
jgi:hypothetical protein